VFELFKERLWEIAIRDISEFVFHARVSLDYIVFALARHDNGGAEYKETYFPICKCPHDFESSRGKIKPLTVEHQTFIEAFQPYFGCDSLLLLNRLSNIDKHRKFVRVGFLGTRAPIPKATSSSSLDVSEMNMNFRQTFDVVLGDGTPAVEALEIVHSQIVQILDAFNTLLE
jgi:hypothetical protein